MMMSWADEIERSNIKTFGEMFSEACMRVEVHKVSLKEALHVVVDEMRFLGELTEERERQFWIYIDLISG